MTADATPTELLDMTVDEKANCPFDEVFAFDRTVSRLLEMRSVEYISRVTRPYGVDFIEGLVMDQSIVGPDNLFREIWNHYSYHCEVVDNQMTADTISRDNVRAAVKDVLLYASIKQPLLFESIIKNFDSNIAISEVGNSINQLLEAKMPTSATRFTNDDFYQMIRPILTLLKNN